MSDIDPAVEAAAIVACTSRHVGHGISAPCEAHRRTAQRVLEAARPLLPESKALAKVKAIRAHNGQSVSPENLRWAATHEALCRSFIFDVLIGLAAALAEGEAS